MSHPALFLDDGGVLNDNARRAPQWGPLVGRFLAPRLGGAPEDWAHANLPVARRLFAAFERTIEEDPDRPFELFWQAYRRDWLHGMCAEVGVPPPEEEETARLAEEAHAFVTRRVRSARPGAVAAVRRLHAAGFRLHTASGERSAELDGYLTGMRLRGLFGERLYGPDLVGVLKAGPRYYAAVFADAGVDPADALVVDDAERALDAAASLGARTALCRVAPPRSARHRHVRSLAELARALGA